MSDYELSKARLWARAKRMAAEVIGTDWSIRKRTGGVASTHAVVRGTIVKCEALEPQITRTGRSLRAYWLVTLKLPSGKLEECTMNCLPRAARPNWSHFDELKRMAERKEFPDFVDHQP